MLVILISFNLIEIPFLPLHFAVFEPRLVLLEQLLRLLVPFLHVLSAVYVLLLLDHALPTITLEGNKEYKTCNHKENTKKNLFISRRIFFVKLVFAVSVIYRSEMI